MAGTVPATRVIQEYRIGTIYTQSWLELTTIPLITADNTVVLTMDAGGSIYNPQTLEEDNDLGVKVIDTGIKRITHKYRARFDDNGNLENPYEIAEVSKSLVRQNIEDMAVDHFSLLIIDPKLGDIVGVPYDRFWMKFQADPADSAIDRKRLDGFPQNQVLIPPFNYRKLHLRFLIDQKQRLTQKKATWKWLIHWRGEHIAGAITHRKAARYIGQTYFGKYGHEKFIDVYIIMEEEGTQLLDIE